MYIHRYCNHYIDESSQIEISKEKRLAFRRMCEATANQYLWGHQSVNGIPTHL